jgi:alpha-beta hydrolase superfamily lysophospholipase
MIERISSFCRLIRFDKRGTGLSDRTAIPTLEQRMDDVRAVMDAVGSKQAALLGVSDGGPLPRLDSATQAIPRVQSSIMTASVDVITNRHTVLHYLLKPVNRAMERALREQ